MGPLEKRSPQIAHISDTALWVAVYRAMETKRSDALFSDPYADLLAGDRGRKIVEDMKGGKRGSWSMIVRTVVFDEFITKVIARDNVDTVVNLAAGLDTRPYRLDLPASLRWIEVDLPDIFAYKEQKLANEQPRCALTRVQLDLNDLDKRRELFAQINRDAKHALIITEGLLIYLSREDVSSLAADLHQQEKFSRWIMDIVSPVLLEWLLKRSFKSFASGDVQMKFAPDGGAKFFEPYGWKESELRSVVRESKKLKREMPMAWLYRLLTPLASKKKRGFYSKLDSYLILLHRT
jgi:methyltransferase (TIGR00027 family)